MTDLYKLIPPPDPLPTGHFAAEEPATLRRNVVPARGPLVYTPRVVSPSEKIITADAGEQKEEKTAARGGEESKSSGKAKSESVGGGKDGDRAEVISSVVSPVDAINKNLAKQGLESLYRLEFESTYSPVILENVRKDNPVIYSRSGKKSYLSDEKSNRRVDFDLPDFKNYVDSFGLLSDSDHWAWDFMSPDGSVSAPYYTPLGRQDRTLVFESRFECGNLGLAVKLSDREYKLTMQNDVLTKGNTQCIYRTPNS